MSLTARFAAALADTDAEQVMFPDRLAVACVSTLPVDGAGVTVNFLPDQRTPVGSSDPASQSAERLQFTLGEGPCLTAHHTRTPVRATADQLDQRWPLYWTELTAHTPFRSVLALPLPGEVSQIVTVDLY
jgi:hypothetical protein